MEQFHPSCHCAIWQRSITTCFSQYLKTGLCSVTSCNFNFYPGALVFLRKHVVRALELGFYTSRRCTMQLNQTQPSPRTVLLQLNFCYQVQTTVLPLLCIQPLYILQYYTTKTVVSLQYCNITMYMNFS
jgi:hypothetical protein